MKRVQYRVSIGQLFLAMAFAALSGSALTIGFSNAHLAMAQAAEVQPEIGKKTEPEKDTKTSCPVVHFDIGCKDNSKTKEFYTKLFDWHVDQQGPAGVIDTGSKEGIQGHITSLGHEPEHYVTVYIQVSDIDTYLKKANKLGGKTLVPAVSIPTGKFAWIGDPDGNIIGLIQQRPTAK